MRDIEAYRRKKLASGLKPTSLNSHLTMLRKALSELPCSTKNLKLSDHSIAPSNVRLHARAALGGSSCKPLFGGSRA